jgi:signal transduction histidine kinase
MRNPTGEISGRIFTFRDVSSQRLVEQMKSGFVSTVSHQLRAPLTSIYASAETLLRHDINFSDEERRHVPAVRRFGVLRGWTAIVDTLLNVARLEAGDLHVELAPTRPARSCSVAGCCGERRHRGAERRSTSSSFELPDEPLEAQADDREAPPGAGQPGRQRRQVLARAAASFPSPRGRESRRSRSR